MEKKYPIGEAVELGSGFRPTYSTIFRWVTKGVKAPDGSRVKLEAEYLGSRLITSIEAVERFQDAIARSRTGKPVEAPKKTRTDAQRQRAIEAAKKRCAKHGVTFE